jgi:hypothetical protein
MSAFAPLPPNLVDVVLPVDQQGYPEHERLADIEAGVLFAACGSASRAFPEKLWIEPSKWYERAQYNDEMKIWPMNFIDRFTMQQPTHECTCHSLRANAEGCRNRLRGVSYPDGPKYTGGYPLSAKVGSVWLSPLSVYAEANPRQWGGAGVRQVLEIACRRGILPDKIQPTDYKFKHSLQGTTGQGNEFQSHGPWVALRNFPDGWQETAAGFKPNEVIFPESWEQAVCLVLHGMFVSVGRSGHAIPWGRAQFSGTSFNGMAYPDSYNVVRFDSLRTVKSAYGGAFSIASMSVPDDWSDPANSHHKSS